ncbi:MAG: PadR family transcriptional regulator [Actinomycetota bacterium]
MSVGMSLLAILDEGPNYGLRLKNEFEGRTAGVWPLNVGQVYTTLARLERDGLVRATSEASAEAHRPYEITEIGRARLVEWFELPARSSPPARDELVLKLVMAVGHPDVNPLDVIQAERRNGVQLLQEYTHLKRDVAADADLGWHFLLESLIFQAEARVRWLDACEARLGRARGSRRQEAAGPHITEAEPSEVRR